MSESDNSSRSVERLLESTMTRRDLLKRGAGLVGAAALAGSVGNVLSACGSSGSSSGGSSAASVTINWLTWPGHDIPSIIEPFEKQTGIKVKAKEYSSGDLGLTELSQNPGVYDAVTTSCEYVPEYVKAGLLMEMDPTEYPAWKDYLPEFQKDIGYNVDGKYYTILYEFGYLDLMYRQDRLSAKDVDSYGILWDPSLKGKVGFQDWWGNSMGWVSLYNGNSPANGKNPFEISNDEFAQVKKTLFTMKPQVAGFYDLAAIFSNFANDTIWAYPGGGDWATLLLRDQGLPVASSVPKEGAVLWGEAISIVKGSKNVDAAKKLVAYLMSPEAQAKLATKPSYSAIVPNQKAWTLLQKSDPSWATRLQMNQTKDPCAITPWRENKIAVRLLPKNQTIEEWANVWAEFKAS
jgi:spermidine/putrescine transport system substrate-binding protein